MEISSDKIYNLVMSSALDCRGKGYITLYNDNTVLKVYYFAVSDAMIKKDKNLIEKNVQYYKDAQEKIASVEQIERDNKKYSILKKLGFLNDRVYYDNCFVGVTMSYYKNYTCLAELNDKLTDDEKKIVVEKIRKQINLLNKNEIYLDNIMERNIMVKISNLDVKLVGIDTHTRYEEKAYIASHEYIITSFEEKYNEMTDRVFKVNCNDNWLKEMTNKEELTEKQKKEKAKRIEQERIKFEQREKNKNEILNKCNFVMKYEEIDKKNYIPLSKVYPNLSQEQKITLLQSIKNKINILKQNNVYVTYLRIANIYVRLTDLDIKMTEINNVETRYEEPSYIKENPFIEKETEESYKRLVKDLRNEYDQEEIKKRIASGKISFDEFMSL